MKILPLIILLFQLNATGQSIQLNWAKSFGGVAVDSPTDLNIDQEGNIFITGVFQGEVDFDPGPFSNNITSLGVLNGFGAKYTSEGNLDWVYPILGGMSVCRKAIIDSSGFVYFLGSFQGPVDFDPGPDLQIVNPTGFGDNTFIVKLTSSGQFVWVKTIGSEVLTYGFAAQLDWSNNIVITGRFSGTVDFDPGSELNSVTAIGEEDLFILKLNSDGEYVWVKTAGFSHAIGIELGIDNTDNIYVVGSFAGPCDLDPGVGVANHYTPIEGVGSFILKLNSSGQYQWSKSFLGSTNDVLMDNSANNLIVTGGFIETVVFDSINVDQFKAVSNGDYDGFYYNVSFDGESNWIKTFGGLGFDISDQCEVDGEGNLLISGIYSNNNVDLNLSNSENVFNSNGGKDGFISKVNSDFVPYWIHTFGGVMDEEVVYFSKKNNGEVVFSGPFSAAVDFDPGTGILNLISNGLSDVFFAEISEKDGSVGDPIGSNYFDFSIYPNPGSEFFVIEFPTNENVDIVLYDLFGRKILMVNDVKSRQQISISDVDAGIYWLHISGNRSDIIPYLKK